MSEHDRRPWAEWPGGLIRGYILAGLLAASLAACTSLEFPLGGPSAETKTTAPQDQTATAPTDTQPAPDAGAASSDTAQAPTAQPADAQAADTQPQAVGAPIVLTGPGTAPSKPGAITPAPAAQPAGEPGASGEQVASAETATPEGVTNQHITKAKPTIASNLSRRFNSLFGSGGAASPGSSSGVETGDVVGVWKLDEEDGLRVCSITLSTGAGNQVLRGPNCGGFIENVASWGLFGPELQLRDEQNTVLARMRQSSEGWVGFTVSTGIPLVMSRT